MVLEKKGQAKIDRSDGFYVDERFRYVGAFYTNRWYN